MKTKNVFFAVALLSLVSSSVKAGEAQEVGFVQSWITGPASAAFSKAVKVVDKNRAVAAVVVVAVAVVAIAVAAKGKKASEEVYEEAN